MRPRSAYYIVFGAVHLWAVNAERTWLCFLDFWGIMFMFVSTAVTVSVEQCCRFWTSAHWDLEGGETKQKKEKTNTPCTVSPCFNRLACSPSQRVSALEVMSSCACVWAGGDERVSWAFFSEPPDSGRKTWSPCVFVCVHGPFGVTDWLASEVASAEIARQSREGSRYHFCSLPSPLHAAGRPHSPPRAKHTPLYPPDILAMLPLRELWLACLPPACAQVNKAQLISLCHNV